MLKMALFGALFVAGLAAYPSSQAMAQSDIPTPPSSCAGYSWCNNGAGAAVVPQGPSQEELQQQHEAKDLDEATQDAWDKGAKLYHAGDWTGAIKYFREALSYDPDNASLQHNLQMAIQHQNDALAAQQHANDSLAAHQLKSLAAHSQTTTDEQSGAVFDYPSGKDAGGLAVPASGAGWQSGDPIVPLGKRTPAIRAFEAKREKDRGEIAAIEVQIKALDPNTNSVEIAKLKQKRTTAEHKVHYLNLQISESVAGPAK